MKVDLGFYPWWLLIEITTIEIWFLILKQIFLYFFFFFFCKKTQKHNQSKNLCEIPIKKHLSLKLHCAHHYIATCLLTFVVCEYLTFYLISFLLNDDDQPSTKNKSHYNHSNISMITNQNRIDLSRHKTMLAARLLIKLSLCNKNPLVKTTFALKSWYEWWHKSNRQIREVVLLHGPMCPNREHSAIWRLLIGMDLCRYVWLILPMFSPSSYVFCLLLSFKFNILPTHTHSHIPTFIHFSLELKN